ncbi:MAG: hypothetical protein GW779_01070 [Candidatus Altiarchaeum hamiconexum]|uniref:Lipoprotein n=1 Tax=Candidatus Altarchaeum hamiconexum TaxID=1803513 RepID=A0A8J7YTU9_9ARCH|nr:hypothetical protein [Candidatus Altarchaeum hamiconexum]NCN68791.1 hypothetical protein [Candidatus Altarchaeum hamiconexum]NCS91004.1 hypothetical protein [Candidatus Altarchaeum hamiconexum]NCT01584.1 hypothetical protein [Candidatus Altarchaeum hamiconexum]
MKKGAISAGICLGIGAAIILMVLLSGCVKQTDNSGNGNMKNLNLTVENITLEKSSYTANEMINFNVTVKSNIKANNVSLHVYGIASRQGNNLIDDTKILNLTEGTTTINYSVIAPQCTRGCGGRYYAGNYLLYAKVKYEDKAINFTLSNTTSVNVNLY